MQQPSPPHRDRSRQAVRSPVFQGQPRQDMIGPSAELLRPSKLPARLAFAALGRMTGARYLSFKANETCGLAGEIWTQVLVTPIAMGLDPTNA